MGACASVDETSIASGQIATFVTVPPAPIVIPVESYFMDRMDLSPSLLLWIEAMEDAGHWVGEEGGIPAGFRERAAIKVVERCTADPSEWRRFMYRELSRSLCGLDEAFEQCTQIAPPSGIGKGKVHSPVRNGEVSDATSGGDNAIMKGKSPSYEDAFLGNALQPYLVELLNASSEIDLLYTIYKLKMPSEERRGVLALTPSKMKSEGVVIDEWIVKRSEWIRGWVGLEVFSLSEARKKVQLFSSELAGLALDSTDRKLFHKFLFRFLRKDPTVQQEAVPKDEAVRLWAQELNSLWSLSASFCNFLQFRYPKKCVTVDQWDMVIDFATAFRYEINLLQYEGQAVSPWPILMDQYIEDTMRLLQDQQDQEGSMGELSQCKDDMAC